jgi:hypothetical protein
MQRWAAAELQTVRLGDARLTKRLITVVEALAAQPTASVPQATGSWAATKAAYRLWDTPTVTPQAILAAHQDGIRARLPGQAAVLAVQDTTELDFSHHPQTQGIGPLSAVTHHGLHVHSALAVRPDGVPLGVVHQQVWARDPAERGKARRRRQLPTAAKESQRWLDTQAGTLAALPAEHPVITVGDAEADIFDLFAQPRRPGADLLIRATHNRVVSDEAHYLWPAVRQVAAGGQIRVAVGRRDDRPPRQATVTVRWTPVMLQPPRHHVQRARLQPLALTAVLAEEAPPPVGGEPICWLLLTTLPVPTLAAALQCVQWYSYRWLIERYHYVLKSGCRVEALQLATAARLERALATYAVVAWRLLWLTYEARRQPTAACTVALEPAEWHALCCTIQRTPTPPAEAPQLGTAVRWIAQLGGFLGRRHDGDPGVTTLWRGLQRLQDIAATWQLAHPTQYSGTDPSPLVGNA